MKPRALIVMGGRVFVGAVFVYAAASKLSAPAEEFAYVIQAYDLVSPAAAKSAAAFLPWIELVIGWALILGVEARAAAAAAGALTSLFLFALGSAVVRSLPLPNCGCFGNATHFTPPQAFLFDSLMAALCWTVFTSESDPLSLDSWAQRGL